MKFTFDSASLLHINFYEDSMDVDEINKRAQHVSDLVDMVIAIMEDYS